MDLDPLIAYVEEVVSDSAAAEVPVPVSPTLTSRYRGTLLGVAAGNGLGLPAEGRSRQWIRGKFPAGLTELSPDLRNRPWGDDLAQTVMLVQALLDRPGLDSDDLAQRLLAWASADGDGIGVQTLAVVREIESGTPAADAAREVWERSGRRAAGNGAVMRCSPVALAWRRSGIRLVEESERSALVTHHDPRCVWSAIALNVALARALSGASVNIPRLSELLGLAGAPDAVTRAVRLSDGAEIEAFALDDRDGMGFTLKALQVGLWCLWQPANFEGVLVQVVSQGGDTDTNGAVAGAVMGSRVGVEGIPQRWVASIAQSERLTTLADRLLARSELGAIQHRGG